MWFWKGQECQSPDRLECRGTTHSPHHSAPAALTANDLTPTHQTKKDYVASEKVEEEDKEDG